MSGDVSLIVERGTRIYDHGPQHPLRPDRVLLTWDLIEACGLDRLPNVQVSGAEPASVLDLERVHTSAFIDATTRAGHGEGGDWGRFGYGPGDNPIFADMHEAGALVCGASVGAAAAVWRGDAEHAFNASGGLHHAMPDRASGFCVYDDPAVAIAWLLAAGAERVAYVDVDVHHGDGPQTIFWNDPRVLTVSLHEYEPPFFFPGTGGLRERGGPDAPGSAINVPLPRGTGDGAWLEALRAIVPRAVTRVRPRRPRDAAGLRHPSHRSAGRAAAHDPRVPRGGSGPARTRACCGEREVGRHRRGRLPVGARRAARVDARVR